jgi:hypothetical protein
MTLLVLAGAATILLSAAIGLLDTASLRTAEGAAERIGAALRATTFQQTMTRSLRWHDRMRSGGNRAGCRLGVGAGRRWTPRFDGSRDNCWWSWRTSGISIHLFAD